jgi:hypothetical protein
MTDIYFVMVLEAEVQDQGVVRLGFSWGLCPGLVVTASCLCPHMAFPLGAHIHGVFPLSSTDTNRIGHVFSFTFNCKHSLVLGVQRVNSQEPNWDQGQSHYYPFLFSCGVCLRG